MPCHWAESPSDPINLFIRATRGQGEMDRVDGIDAVMTTTPDHVHFAASKVFLGRA